MLILDLIGDSTQLIIDNILDDGRHDRRRFSCEEMITIGLARGTQFEGRFFIESNGVFTVVALL